MENKIVKPKMVIQMRNGHQLLLDKEKSKLFIQECEKKRFIRVGDEWINTADMSGLFLPETIERKNREKAGKGKWKCEKHDYEIEYGKKCGYCESGIEKK